jgi:hypothetical protein
LLMFLATVDELADLASIADKACIKAVIRYTDPDEAEVWECLDEYSGNSFVDFANTILHLYLECGPITFNCTVTAEAVAPLADPYQGDALTLMYHNKLWHWKLIPLSKYRYCSKIPHHRWFSYC